MGSEGPAGVASATALAQAVHALRAGEVVAFPTETVYGLGADARRPEALRRVYELKGRPRNHPLIVHLADAAQARAWAGEWPEAAQRLAARHWPGPLTLVVPRSRLAPDEVTGGQETVALRVPSHPIAQALLREFGGAIAAPSANRYGHVSPTSARHVRDEFGAAVPVVLDGGECEVGLESTIVACLAGSVTLLRPGGIGLAALRAAAGEVGRAGTAAGPQPRTPGSTIAHYAPRTPLALRAGGALRREALERAAAGERLGVLALGPAPAGAPASLAWREGGADPVRYGHDLYARLRELDRLGLGQLLVEQVPADEPWDAVRDRLARAAAATGPAAPDDDEGDLP